MEKGYVQVYTGNGKGKTTAALGLGLRAVGGGFKVIMFQFLKGVYSSELNGTPLLGENFKIIRLAEADKFLSTLSEDEKEKLKNRLQEELVQIREVLRDESCDLLILDEVMAAIHSEMLAVEEVCALIDSRPTGMEMVLTGRSAPQEILDRADLVTEMCCVKHYMDRGIKARPGIEK